MAITDEDLERLRAYLSRGRRVALEEAGRLAVDAAIAAPGDHLQGIEIMIKTLQTIRKRLAGDDR
jgi:hypothetical protein